MARRRSTGTATVASAEQHAQAESVVAECVAEINTTIESVFLRLNRIEHPVQRAKAVYAVRRLVGESAGSWDPILRDAVLEAYALGKSGSGWYGYGALAEDLGVSRARVQQIVTGSWKPGEKDQAGVEALRERARQDRLARQGIASDAGVGGLDDDEGPGSV